MYFFLFFLGFLFPGDLSLVIAEKSDAHCQVLIEPILAPDGASEQQHYWLKLN